jgi:hypothetical protein
MGVIICILMLRGISKCSLMVSGVVEMGGLDGADLLCVGLLRMRFLLRSLMVEEWLKGGGVRVTGFVWRGCWRVG